MTLETGDHLVMCLHSSPPSSDFCAVRGAAAAPSPRCIHRRGTPRDSPCGRLDAAVHGKPSPDPAPPQRRTPCTRTSGNRAGRSLSEGLPQHAPGFKHRRARESQATGGPCAREPQSGVPPGFRGSSGARPAARQRPKPERRNRQLVPPPQLSGAKLHVCTHTAASVPAPTPHPRKDARPEPQPQATGQGVR